jgi:hypothetical protein
LQLRLSRLARQLQALPPLWQELVYLESLSGPFPLELLLRLERLQQLGGLLRQPLSCLGLLLQRLI